MSNQDLQRVLNILTAKLSGKGQRKETPSPKARRSDKTAEELISNAKVVAGIVIHDDPAPFWKICGGIGLFAPGIYNGITNRL